MPSARLTDIVTPPQLAEEWSCTPAAVRALLEAGLLQGFRIGRCHWRIRRSAIEAFERGERPQQIPALRTPRRKRIEVPAGPF